MEGGRRAAPRCMARRIVLVPGQDVADGSTGRPYCGNKDDALGESRKHTFRPEWREGIPKGDWIHYFNFPGSNKPDLQKRDER